MSESILAHTNGPLSPAIVRVETTNRTRAANYAVRVVRFTVVREPDAAPIRTLSQPDVVADVAHQLMPDDAREHFGVLMLNARHGLVAYHEVSVGTLSSSLVHPREVFGPALRMLGVSSLILLHNHPSGDPEPSREDLRITRQLVDAAKLLDLTIHDHVILGNGSGDYVSLGRGLI
jgi:DNA repair protein RadC